jgi:hypothetical protein
MTTPPRRVFARAMFEHLGVIQDLLNASTDVRRSLRLSSPHRFQHRQNVLGVNLVRREVTNNRINVIPEGAHPLLARALTPPTAFVACDIGTGAFGKRWRLLGVLLLAQRGPLIAFALKGVLFRHKSADDIPVPSGGLAAG